MIITAHQPVYLPWLGLFHKIALADEFVYYDHVQHSAHDYTARNFIKTSQGKHQLIVPVKKARSLSIRLKDLKIDQTAPWRRNHWNTIKMNYARSKYFHQYKDFLYNLYQKDWEYISDLNYNLLKYFLSMIGLDTKVICSSDLEINGEKIDGVLEMCNKLNADTIIFGKYGMDYVNLDLFNKAGIKCIFQDYIHPRYNQIFGDFIPNLSILDLLMNYGEKSLDIIMSGNLSKNEIIN